MQTAVDRSQNPLETSPAAFILERGEAVIAPVIFASPHSGSIYPRQMTDLLSVPVRDLERTEDAFVDELYAAAPQQGSILLHATFARAFVDLNRDARELDASMFSDGVPRVAGMPSARVKAGLGC